MLWGVFFTQGMAANWVVSLPALEKVLQPVLGAEDRVSVLIPPGRSPHHWQLTPSQLRQLAEADYVVIVDVHLESALARWLKAHKKPVLIWREQPGIQVLEVENQGHGDGHHAHEMSYNPHIWLSPHNIFALWQGLRAQGWISAHRQADAMRALRALDAELTQQLQSVRHVPFVVLHDAFAYFEAHYHLNKVGVVDVDANTPMTLRQFQQVRALLQQKQVRCVIYPDTQSVKTLKRLVAGLPVRLQGLDALGWHAASLEAWLKQLAKGYRTCLMPS